jgi:hypothetical protein
MGRVGDIASELLRRAVPIVIYSGYREDEDLPPNLSGDLDRKARAALGPDPRRQASPRLSRFLRTM